MHSSPAPAATVEITQTELDVTLANGATAALPVTLGTVVDPEALALAGGGEVITWIEAFSHSLQAHYAVLDANGQVLADSTYGHGFSTGFEAIAARDGGFVLADGEADLFGVNATLTAQAMSPTGAAEGSAVTVASRSGATGGFYYSDLEGGSNSHATVITWDDPNGAHLAYFGSDGSVEQASAHDFQHALTHHTDWFGFA